VPIERSFSLKKAKLRVKPQVVELDDRVRRSRKAVLAATLQLLAEGGLSGVSVDEVSKRSGVAKTTIYRHWPSREALLLEACSTIGTRADPPDAGSFKGDLSVLLSLMAKRLKSERWATILPSIIDAAERDEELARLASGLHAGHMAPLYAIIERAKNRGELPADIESSEIVAAIVGPLFYRRWFSRQPISEQFVGNIVKRICGVGKKER
jgi:AcrR family transcriptional regulator